MGGCEPQIEDIVKLKKSGSGWWGLVGGQVGVRVGRGFDDVNQELKVLLKEHKGILQLITYSKKYENGGPQPSRVIENERKLKEIWKYCVPLSGFEPRTLRLEVLHLTTRLRVLSHITG